MQSISIKQGKSRFISEPHLIVTIDGEALDERLAKSLTTSDPGTAEWIHGLISPWNGWLDSPKEQAVVDTRMLMFSDSPTILPILVCPDDLDLSCTVIVAEVLHTPHQIMWARVGINQPQASQIPPEFMGCTVKWLKGIGPMRFNRDAYVATLSTILDTRDSQRETSP